MADEKLPGRNTLARRIGPGIWEDADGNTHLSAVELMELFGVENTPENLKATMDYVQQLLKNQGIKGVERLTPED